MKTIVLLMFLAVTGCEYLPVRGPDVVRPPAAFKPFGATALGPAHGQVIGIAGERLRAAPDRLAYQRDQALLASLDAETVPVRADPEAPVPGRATIGLSADEKARAQKAVDEGLKAGIAAGLPPDLAAGPAGGAPTGTPPVSTAAQQPLPTTAAATARTADLNNDGFITLDEVIALHRARVADAEIAKRIQASGFVLGATTAQIDHLRAFGVSDAALTPFNPQPPRVTQGHRSSVEPW